MSTEVRPFRVERDHLAELVRRWREEFDSRTVETGWDLDRHVRTLVELMTRLGHERFVVQGGDWGSIIGPHVSRLAPGRVSLVHVNALASAVIVDWSADDPTAGLSDDDVAEVSAAGAMWAERSGYATIMGRPSAG